MLIYGWLFFSPTVLHGCTDSCFLSFSLSLRRWQRWWWWWWWALSWLWTCLGPVEDWVKLCRSRSNSLSPTSGRCCCVSEEAERLIGLRSTIGWQGKRSVQTYKKRSRNRTVEILPKLLMLDHQKWSQHINEGNLLSKINLLQPADGRSICAEWTLICDQSGITIATKFTDTGSPWVHK